MTKLCSKQAIHAVKNDHHMEITQRQHEVDVQILLTVLQNIGTNKHTIFQVIPTYDDKDMLGTSKKCYKKEIIKIK